MALLAHAAGLLVSTPVQALLYKLAICNQEERSAVPIVCLEVVVLGRKSTGEWYE